MGQVYQDVFKVISSDYRRDNKEKLFIGLIILNWIKRDARRIASIHMKGVTEGTKNTVYKTTSITGLCANGIRNLRTNYNDSGDLYPFFVKVVVMTLWKLIVIKIPGQNNKKITYNWEM